MSKNTKSSYDMDVLESLMSPYSSSSSKTKNSVGTTSQMPKKHQGAVTNPSAAQAHTIQVLNLNIGGSSNSNTKKNYPKIPIILDPGYDRFANVKQEVDSNEPYGDEAIEDNYDDSIESESTKRKTQTETVSYETTDSYDTEHTHKKHKKGHKTQKKKRIKTGPTRVINPEYAEQKNPDKMNDFLAFTAPLSVIMPENTTDGLYDSSCDELERKEFREELLRIAESKRKSDDADYGDLFGDEDPSELEKDGQSKSRKSQTDTENESDDSSYDSLMKRLIETEDKTSGLSASNTSGVDTVDLNSEKIIIDKDRVYYEEDTARDNVNGYINEFIDMFHSNPQRKVDRGDCFACSWKAKKQGVVNSTHLQIICEMLDKLYLSMPTTVIAKNVHRYYMKNVYHPKRKKGEKVPIWRSWQIKYHMEHHIRDPNVYIGEEIEKEKSLYNSLAKICMEVHEYRDGDKRMTINRDVFSQMRESQKRIERLYKMKPKEMNFFDPERKVNLSMAASFLNHIRSFE